MVVDKNVAYAGGWYPHHNDQDLEEIKAAGCTSINMTVNETDWYLFRAARERIVAKARELGLKFYLNWHGFGAFASYIQSTRYLLEHPEAAQYFSNGVRSAEAMACPNNPEYAAWMEERSQGDHCALSTGRRFLGRAALFERQQLSSGLGVPLCLVPRGVSRAVSSGQCRRYSTTTCGNFVKILCRSS